MPNIEIKVEHGMIAAIEGLPTDIAIEVFNYDIADRDAQHLSEDEDGKRCEIKEWHAPE
jgi:hypothetical protein